MRSLLEISPLEQLTDLCRELKVDLTAYGGMVTRALLSGDKNLFAATPFTCDIDLYHSGPENLTPAVIRQLFERMPLAELFRWEVRAQSEVSTLATNCNVIPARAMELSAGSGLIDRYRGQADLESRKFRFLRHPRYEMSLSYRQDQDLEIFSALLYLRLLSEAEIGLREVTEQPGLETCRAIFADAANLTTIIRLQDSSHLRMRLRYLMDALAAAAPKALHEALFEESGFRKFVDFVEAHDRMLAARLSLDDVLNYGVKVVSAHLGGDTFRAARFGGWFGEGPLIGRSALPGQQRSQPLSPDLRMAAGNIVLAALDPIKLAPGRSKSSAIGGRNHEFLHFQIALPEYESWAWSINNPDRAQTYDARFLARRLSLVFQLSIDGSTYWMPLPTCASLRSPTLNDGPVLFTRTNAYGLLSAAAAHEDSSMTVLLMGLQYQSRGETNPGERNQSSEGPTGDAIRVSVEEAKDEDHQERQEEEERELEVMALGNYGRW